MSEFINMRHDGRAFQRRLLTTVSALALTASLIGEEAKAASNFLASDTPPVWIEVGGQFDMLNRSQTEWLPPLASVAAGNGAFVQRAPLYGYDLDAGISFQPNGSDWLFSASVRYGRGIHHKQFHTQAISGTVHDTHPGIYAFEDYDSRGESIANHAIVDFRAGRDFGLGLVGHGGSSVVSVGVRVAQFNSKAEDFVTDHPARGYERDFSKQFLDQSTAHRNLWAIGPSVSWDATARIGGSDRGGFTFDWGVKAAALFGRQKAAVHITSQYELLNESHATVFPPTFTTVHATHVRSRQVVVPNIGGFAGLSLRWPAAKLSLGYRADLFFGAMDGGIDTARRENVGFYGPFATLSIGIGG